MKPDCVVVAHPLPIVRDQLQQVIKEQVSAPLIFTTHEGELRKSCREGIRCWLVVGTRLHGQPTLELIRTLLARNEQLRVLVIVDFPGEAAIRHFIRIGVQAIWAFNQSTDQIRQALQVVELGGRYYPEEYYASLLETTHGKPDLPAVTFADKEYAVLVCLSKGWSSKRIAYELKIKENTVNCYRERLMWRTKSLNVAGLISFSYQNGLLPPYETFHLRQ